MTTVYVGSLSIGATMPAATAAVTAGADGISAAFPDLAARLAALEDEVARLATLPPLPSFADMLAKAEALVAAITLAMATPGLPSPPSIASAIATLEALLAALTVTVGDLTAKASLIAALRGHLAAAGVHVIAYDGDLSALGADIQSAVTSHVGASGHANALALVTTVGATWTDMSTVFKVTP